MAATGSRFDVAVFPLPNGLLFPGVSLPLHLFEGRYTQMLRDVEARGWPLAVSLAMPFSATEFVLNTVCGAGRVERLLNHPDGQSRVLVHGEMRVKLVSFVQREPYFVMEAEEIVGPGSASTRMERTLDEFKSLLKAWVFINPKVPDNYCKIFDEYRDPGALSDFFVFHFLKRASDKQVYLNCADPAERAEMLSRFLETDLQRLARKVTRAARVAVMH